MSRTRRLFGLCVVAGLLILGSVSGPNLRGQDKKVEEKKSDAPPAKGAAAPKAVPAQGAAKPGAPGGPAKAQPKVFTDAVTVPTNRESRQLIQAAQDYIKKQDWRTAAECLQSLLDAKEDSFIEVDGKDDKGNTVQRRVSVRMEASRLIGELPPEGLEFYQVQYGPAADNRLKEGLDKNDAHVYADVSLRFLHTKAGAEATNLLGTYHLDRGNYLTAALCFERLLTKPDADKLPFRILFKAALAFRRAGDGDNGERLWKKLADKAGRGEIMVGRQKVTIEQLRQEFERSAGLLTQLSQHDWPVYHGNPARNAQGIGSTAFLEPHWKASMFGLDETNALVTSDQVEANKKVREYVASALDALGSKPRLPTFFPIAAGGKLVYRTYDGVYAVSLKDVDTADGKTKAGDMIWISPTPSGLYGMMHRTDRQMTLNNWYKSNYASPTMGPVGVLFENAIIGTLSHDGQRVYFVDDLAVPPHPQTMQTQNVGSQSFSPFDKEVQGNRLVSADLETGKVLWTINDRDIPTMRDSGERKETNNAGLELTDAFFLGPPLPLGGKLYVLVEKNGELRLVCLDPTKVVTFSVNNKRYTAPEIVWQQTLGSANFKLPQDTMRRLQAAHLAYADGIIVCPTNAGLILGVDLLSHSLVWAHSYRDANSQNLDENIMPRGGRGRGVMTNWTPNQDRWRPSTPVIQNGKVIFTAFDGASIHCLNLRDGRLLWHTPRKVEDDLYLGGVFGTRVVIVGKNHVRALNLDDGKELWSTTTESLPSGQGAASENVYYLPLQGVGEKKEPSILAINLETGNRVAPPARSRKKDPLGNLLFVDGELISQTAQTVSAYPELKRMLAEIDRRLKDNSNDPIGLTERGELYLDKGELTRAVEDLRTALTQTPPPETRTKARSKLHEALTDLFKNDFNAAEKYLDEYHELCKVEVPPDVDNGTKLKLAEERLRREADYLSLLGRGREKQGRLLDALAAYEEFGALTGNKELVSSIDERYTRSRPDVWSRGRIKGMIDQATPEQRQQLEAAIAQRWTAIRDKGDLDALRKFVAIFGTSFQVGREAQLSLAERLLAIAGPDEITEAEIKLKALCFSPDLRRQDPTMAAKSLEAMIRIYIRRELYEDAVGFYKQLGTEFANVVVRDGKTGADLLNELFTDKRFLPYLESHGLSWRGTLKSEEKSGTSNLRENSMTVVPEGNLLPFFDRHRLVLDTNTMTGNSWTLRLLDRATSEERWKQSNLPAALYFTNATGGTQFVQLGGGQIGVMNAQGAIIQVIQGNVPNIPATTTGLQNHRFAFAKGHTLVLHLNNMVFAHDLAERKEVWRYNLYGQNPILGNTQNFPQIDADGKVVVPHVNDGRLERIGGVAVVESNYICLQGRVTDELNGGTREGLIALDPHRPGPSILWTKSDVSLRAQVFGDDQHVYIVEPGGGNVPPSVRALRAQDGVSVAVPDFGSLYTRRIRTIGRCLLLHDDEPQGGKVLRLYDVQTGQDVWRKSFSAGAWPIRSEDPSLTGVVEKDHSATFLDAPTGRVLFKSVLQAEHVERLHEVAAVTDRNHIYLALTRPAENGSRWSPYVSTGMRSLSLNGPLYALDRTSGKLDWVCDFLQYQTLLLEQMQDLPLLLFTSQFTKTANGNVQQVAVRVTGVDKRTGKLLYDKEFAQGTPSFQALNANPVDGKIELVRQDLKITFTAVHDQAGQAGTPPSIR